jgi:hypothetical protein
MRVALPQQSGQRRRAGALGNVVGILEAGAHGLGDLVLAHAHDALRTPLDDRQRLLVRDAAGHAVGKGVGRIGRNRAILLERQGNGGCIVCDDANDLGVEPKQITHRNQTADP